MKLAIIALLILSIASPVYSFEAQVERVVDGDTYEFTGYMLNTTVKGWCRMQLYNAPEVKGKERPQGLLSKDALIGLIAGKRVEIKADKTDKYGRWLCQTWLPDGTSVDEVMMEKLKDYTGLLKYQWMNKTQKN
jgi:micrococcal nuclease